MQNKKSPAKWAGFVPNKRFFSGKNLIVHKLSLSQQAQFYVVCMERKQQTNNSSTELIQTLNNPICVLIGFVVGEALFGSSRPNFNRLVFY